MKIIKHKYINYICILVSITLFIYILFSNILDISMEIQPSTVGSVQLYYDNKISQEECFSEEHSKIYDVDFYNTIGQIKFRIPLSRLEKVRIDFNSFETVDIQKISVDLLGISLLSYEEQEMVEKFELKNNVDITDQEKRISIQMLGEDPFIGTKQVNTCIIRVKIFILALILSILVVIVFRKKIYNITQEHLLISIFLCILLLPSIIYSFIYEDNSISNENRVLKEKPNLKIFNILRYPNEFNQYYEDHIPFKNQIVTFNSYIKYNIFDMSPTDYVIKGKKDWLFYNSKEREETDSISDYLGTNIYNEKDLKLIMDKLLEKNDYLNDQGIEFYIMICPNKERIYSEYMPDYYNIQNEENRADKLVQYLVDNTTLNIIYPKEELIKNKKYNYLYYKWDTHWNKAGGFIGFNELMKVMGLKSEDYSRLYFDEVLRTGGDLVNMINMSPKGTDYDYLLQNENSNIEVNNIKNENAKAYYTSNASIDKKILVFRDSFGEAMIPYISKTFNESIFTTERSFDYGLINQEKPDIVVFEVVERGIDVLKQ